jgi:hypothetical protein
MIIREKDTEVLEVEMFHIVNVGKHNAIVNFRQYLMQLLAEFEKEHTRYVYQSILPSGYTPSGNGHIIVPDDK